jgi:hypothetical protein
MPSTARSKRIKPLSRETRFLRLRGLKCFQEVHQRLLEGWAPSKVAEFIQEECKEYTDVGRPSLESQLKEYRASLPPGDIVKERLPRFHAQQAEKVEEGFDELAEMEKLYKMQMKRIELDFKTEQNIGKLMPSMTQEMRAAREILSDIAQLKMDLGVNKRHLGEVDVRAKVIAEIGSRYDATVTKAMESPESRRKLLGLADKFLSLASGATDVEDAEIVSAEPPPADPAELNVQSVPPVEKVMPAPSAPVKPMPPIPLEEPVLSVEPEMASVEQEVEAAAPEDGP